MVPRDCCTTNHEQRRHERDLRSPSRRAPSNLAQVDVQNHIKRVESRLPESVTRQGLQVKQASANFLLTMR